MDPYAIFIAFYLLHLILCEYFYLAAFPIFSAPSYGLDNSTNLFIAAALDGTRCPLAAIWCKDVPGAFRSFSRGHQVWFC